MTKAFVLLNANLGSENEVQAQLENVEGIVGVYQVYGVYDFVIEIEAASPLNLKEIVFSKIRTLKDVRSTLTLSEVALS